MEAWKICLMVTLVWLACHTSFCSYHPVRASRHGGVMIANEEKLKWISKGHTIEFLKTKKQSGALWDLMVLVPCFSGTMARWLVGTRVAGGVAWPFIRDQKPTGSNLTSSTTSQHLLCPRWQTQYVIRMCVWPLAVIPKYFIFTKGYDLSSLNIDWP